MTFLGDAKVKPHFISLSLTSHVSQDHHASKTLGNVSGCNCTSLQGQLTRKYSSNLAIKENGIPLA